MITVTVVKPSGVNVSVLPRNQVNVEAAGGMVNTGGPRDYGRLSGKPRINGHELRSGENNFEEMNLIPVTFLEIAEILQS